MGFNHVVCLVWLFFLHTVADFVLQTDWMAKNKSSSNKALLRHTTVYSLAVSCMMIPVGLSYALQLQIAIFCVWFLTSFLCHTATDYVTSRMTSYLWKKERRHDFFVVIGFDQFLHMCQLLVTYWACYGVL